MSRICEYYVKINYLKNKGHAYMAVCVRACVCLSVGRSVCCAKAGKGLKADTSMNLTKHIVSQEPEECIACSSMNLCVDRIRHWAGKCPCWFPHPVQYSSFRLIQVAVSPSLKGDALSALCRNSLPYFPGQLFVSVFQVLEGNSCIHDDDPAWVHEQSEILKQTRAFVRTTSQWEEGQSCFCV